MFCSRSLRHRGQVLKSSALLCLVLSVSLPAIAAERAVPWEGPAFEATGAAMVRAASKLPDPAEGTDVEVLLKEGQYTELAPHRWRATSRTVFRILTSAGVRQWAEARAEWSPWRQQRPVLRARVISPDGKEHLLDEKTLHDAPVEDPAPDIYTDTRALRAPLPALRPGSVVEMESVVEDTQPFFDAGVVTHFYFASPVPVRKVRLGIDVAPSTQLTLRVRGLPLEPLPQHQSDRKRLSFEGGPYAPVAPLEEDVPPSEAFYPHVAFSTGRSWNEVASTYHRIIEGRLEGASLQARARGLVKGVKDRRAIAQRLLEHVRESVRYTGLEFGAAAIVPASPQEVLQRQYGDCKELSTLLVGLLRGAGVPAHVALVRSGREDVPELPGMGFFNHAIVYVPGTPALWMDPTDAGGAVGMLAPELQGRHALVATPDTQGLTRIDEAQPEGNTAIFTRTVTLSDEGPARVHETRELEGALAVQYRRLLRAVRPADFRRNMEAVATAQFQGTLEGMKHTPLDDGTGPFRLELDVASARFATTGWRSARVPLRLESPLAWLPDALDDVRDLLPDELGRMRPPTAKRQSDLVLPVAYRAEVRYRLEPPTGFALQSVPRDETLPLGPATLALRYQREQDGGLSATFRFDAVRRRYTRDEVAAFRTALAALARREPLVVEFEDKGSRLVEGARVRDGLAVYEKGLNNRSDSALVRARYAGTLLRLGFGEQARAEARRAVEQRPSSPLVHHVLAWVLQHDLYGRLRRPGADLEGAVTACRQAITLEPENLAAHLLLADLLEHNARGERFGQGAKLTEAVATWRHLRDTLGARDVDDRLLAALFRSGATADALEAARASSPSELRDRVLVMATAEVKGAAEAISAAERELEGLDSRRDALALAGDHLLTRGRSDVAAQLFEAALKGAYDPDRKFKLELARKPRTEAKQDKGPEALVRRIVLAAWTSRDAKEFESAILPFLSSRDRKDSALHQKLEALHAQASRYAASMPDGVGAKSMAELAVAALDLKPEGQEKVGYRVRLNVLLGGQAYEDVWYVVRENKEYKLLASASDPRPLGAEALRWLDASQLKEALLWIGWAVQDARDVPPEGLSPLASFTNTLRGFSGMEAVTQLRAACAYLGASTGDARVLAALRAQAKFAAGEERHRLLMALAVVHRAAGRSADAEALVDEVREDVPVSSEAFWLKREFLTERGQWTGLRDAAEGRLGLLHTDALGLETQLVAAVNLRDWDDAEKTGKQLVKLGTAGADAYRSLAWAALLKGRATSEDVEWAQRAVRMSPTGDVESLALLATLLVETGKLEEGRKLADTALAQDLSGDVDPGVLYVRARLAEAFGLPEAARALYRAMPPAQTPDARSFQRLAQGRLAGGRKSGMTASRTKK
ncbi:DUF3857 and transglutaminase domain-containing protein [Pyxidicoccus xibeiensis]|uniref:DUF3857 and transglutaminase domain-containing protein n=1 Tax=Pyxidicoccus xibeiensis TaxID=2906759 RepID=UPI0020A7CE24|nr:DUF3857 and transglutaminase domain-containing protein [Pyxidicoccus xibeiensis]MCP3137285.1 DUF3857 and transglutaminase domain-containing protein [Pyxidicoccus xibeiensis]